MKKIITALIALIVISASILYFTYNKNVNKLSGTARDTSVAVQKDITKQAIDSNEAIKNSKLLSDSKKYKEAREVLAAGLAQEKNSEVKSIIDLTLASNYLSTKEYATATRELLKVGKDVSYPNTTRAFALTTILQQYSGTNNIELLKVFGEVDKDNINKTLESAHRQILSLHPMGISVAYVARIDMKKNPEKAAEIYSEAITKIDNDIIFENRGDGSNYIVPNIILAKLSLMINAEKLGLATSSEIIATYKDAIRVSKEKLQIITSQFAILRYINYMGNNAASFEKEIEEALNILEKESLTEMVINSLSRPNAKDSWKGIVNIVSKNKNYEKYFKQFGW